MGRIHISGGEDLSRVQALYRGDKTAIAALLAMAGGSYYPIGHQPPQLGKQGGGNVLVGADVRTQPDGSAPDVEFLPLAGAAGVSIAAGATTPFELKPTRPFQATALLLDDDIAKNLLLGNLNIGGQPVIRGAGVLIGRGFSHASFTNMLSTYWADNSSPITFDLTNIHASAAQVVRGHFVGNTVAKPA